MNEHRGSGGTQGRIPEPLLRDGAQVLEGLKDESRGARTDARTHARAHTHANSGPPPARARARARPRLRGGSGLPGPLPKAANLNPRQNYRSCLKRLGCLSFVYRLGPWVSVPGRGNPDALLP